MYGSNRGSGPGLVQECLFCHKTGHVSGNCPNRNTTPPAFSAMAGVKSTGSTIDMSSVSTQPIESLTPFVGNKWWIKARVTDKTAIRTWNNARSQGKLFSMTLIDHSGPIRATIFQEGVDRYYDTLTEGNIYLFSRGQVKTANKKFCSVNCEYELSFDKDAEIQPVRSNDPSSQVFPQKVYSFVPLQSLKTREVGCTIDILAVVMDVHEPSTFTSKSGNQLTKRTIGVMDASAAIDVTVWDQSAINWVYPKGTLICMRSVRLSEFQGELSLSLSQSSSIEQEPQCPDTVRLQKWFENQDNLQNVVNLSKGNGSEGQRGGQITRNTLEDISRLSLGKSEKPDYINVRLTSTFIKTDNMYYDACPDCNKKLTPSGMDGSGWRCEKCDKMKEMSDPRFLVSMMVSDGVQSSWITIFNDIAIKLFGLTAAELKQSMLTDPNAPSTICAPRVLYQFIGRVRVKEERYAEGEDRMKLTLAGIRWLGPEAPVGEASSSFVTECNLLIKDIEAYLSV